MKKGLIIGAAGVIAAGSILGLAGIGGSDNNKTENATSGVYVEMSDIEAEYTTEFVVNDTTTENRAETTVVTTVPVVVVTDATTSHTHIFAAATCTSPKKCPCGATEGEAKGHSWKDATCSDPKTCTVCNATVGTTAGHSYHQGSCSSCGKEDPDYNNESMVWIPTNGGKKYHSHAGCSNMDDPDYVTQSKAESLGFTPCKKCF